MTEKEEITSLPVWVWFPVLPVEYYSKRWIKKTDNHIGRMIKIDTATLFVSREKFARVCVEVDLRKPLKSGYRLRGEYRRLRYEGLHDLCFLCGRYCHRE